MPASEGDLSRRILVVEDERIVALDLQMALEQLGHTVRTAASSEEATEIAAEFVPHLALMDIRLRGAVDGIETAALLQARHAVAIVYLTANTDASTFQRALLTNPGGYLAKPFNTNDLDTTIAVALRQHESELALRRERADLELRRAALEQQTRELGALVEKLREESVSFADVVARELSLAKRETRSVGFVMLGFDQLGDRDLRDITSHLRQTLRAHDSACRYSNDQLVLVLPGASLGDAQKLAERLRVELEQLAPGVAVSFGISAYPGHGETEHELIAVALAALELARKP